MLKIDCIDRKIVCVELSREYTTERDSLASLNGYRYLLEQVACLLRIASHLGSSVSNLYELFGFIIKYSIYLDYQTQLYVLAIVMYLDVLYVAASLATDPATDEVTVRCEST